MNPFEAYKYMKETGLSVKAERTPPWIDNPNWINIHYKWRNDDFILSMFGEVLVDEMSMRDWINWWMNFCYNSTMNQTELLPL